MQLRKKITSLQTYRRLGIRTHAEIEQYEIDLKSRQDEMRARHYRSSHGFGRRAGADDGSTSPRHSKKKVRDAPPPRSVSQFRSALDPKRWLVPWRGGTPATVVLPTHHHHHTLTEDL